MIMKEAELRRRDAEREARAAEREGRPEPVFQRPTQAQFLRCECCVLAPLPEQGSILACQSGADRSIPPALTWQAANAGERGDDDDDDDDDGEDDDEEDGRGDSNGGGLRGAVTVS